MSAGSSADNPQGWKTGRVIRMSFPRFLSPLLVLSLAACSTTTPTSLPVAAAVTATHTQSSASTTATANIQTPEPSETASLITPMTPIAIEQMKANFIQLLQPNPDCILPCWGGVEPGKTTWGETVLHFLNRGATIKYLLTLNNGVDVFEVNGFGFDTVDELWTSAQVINLYKSADMLVGLKVFAEGRTSAQEFTSLWSQYLPEAVLQNGLPSEVWIEPRRESPQFTSYGVWLRFNDDGYWVRYRGRSDAEGSNYPICLSMTDGGNLGKTIEVFSIGSTDQVTITDLYESVTGPILFYINREIENSIGLTIEEFRQLLLTHEGKAECIYTPVE